MKNEWSTMSCKLVLLLIGPCLLLMANVALSQTGQVKGTIVSPSGNPIEGASVNLVSSADDQIGRKPVPRLSGTDGSFRIQFDWAEIANATRQGAVWEVVAEKANYVPGRASVRLVSGQTPPEVKITLSSDTKHSHLTSSVDACVDPRSNTSTLYFFDFTNDSTTPQKVKKFQELLLYKLRNGVRTKLQAAGLLNEFSLEIKACHEAPVTDESDAVFAGKRLRCAGVIYGFVEEKKDKFESLVSFTVPSEPPLTDVASDVSSNDLSALIEPSLEVGKPYLAFSSFALGRLYLQAKQNELAMKCFRYAQTNAPKSSLIAAQSEILLKQVEQNSPAFKLTPVGGTPP
jgi:hypothetical protein